MKGKKILITGGTGFIASWLVEKWYKDNQITLYDNGRRNAFRFLPRYIQDRVKVVLGNVQNIKSIQKVVKNQQIIIHLAAIAGASFYEKDPLLTLNTNLFGTANLLKSLATIKVEHVILFSSSEVYGTQAVDVSEEDPTCIGSVMEGRWSYAVSKVASDHLAVAYTKSFGLPITILRPFNIYGPRQIGEGAITNMIKSAIEKGEIMVTGDGQQKRAWCFISDLVDVLELIYKKKAVEEIFNIGNPKEYLTIKQLAKKISFLINNSKVVFTQGMKSEILARKPNIDRARKYLGYDPKIGIDKGLKLTHQWFRENIQNL